MARNFYFKRKVENLYFYLSISVFAMLPLIYLHPGLKLYLDHGQASRAAVGGGIQCIRKRNIFEPIRNMVPIN